MAVTALQGKQGESVVGLTSKAVASLDEVNALMHGGKCNPQAVRAVEENAQKLQTTIESMSCQRVIMLSADQLMEAGGSCITHQGRHSSLQSCDKEEHKRQLGDVRFPVLFIRFWRLV